MKKLVKITLPAGWNGLINEDDKTVLLIGEYKVASLANTALTLINKQTKDELMSSIPSGFKVIYPVKK